MNELCAVYYSVPRRCILTNAKAVIMLLTAILIFVNVHYFWSFDRVSFAVAPGEPRTMYCTFTQNELRQSVFFQETVLPALENTIAELLPTGLLIVCSIVMITCVARGHHLGTATYRQWRQRYTLEPHGVEQLVWICVNVSLMTVCLTVPLNVVHVVRYVISSSATDVITDEMMEFEHRISLIETVCTQLQYCSLSLNIFVYVASSSRFRYELRSIFYLGVK